MRAQIEQLLIGLIERHGIKLHAVGDRPIRRGDGSVATVLVLEARPKRWVRWLIRAEARVRAVAPELVLAAGCGTLLLLVADRIGR